MIHRISLHSRPVRVLILAVWAFVFLILFVGLAGLVHAAPAQLCYLPDKDKPTAVVCYELTPELSAALATYTANQKTDTGEPRYTGIADLIIQNLANGLFQAAITAHPPPAVQNAKTAEQAAVEATKAAKDSVLAVPIVLDPVTIVVPKQ
jgi:hypothetical protein